jgi:predicted dehydrogenase
VAIAWHVQTRATTPGTTTWKNEPKHGGGALNGFASHAVHALEWLAGPVTRVLARVAPLSTTEAERRVDALFELRSGATASLSIATDATLGTGHRIEVYGDDGALVLENRSRDYARNFTLSFGTRATDRLDLVDAGDFDADGADGRVAAVRAVVGRFVDAIATKGIATPSLLHGARAQILIDGIRAASHASAWQSV